MILAVDIGNSQICLGLLDSQGRVAEHWRIASVQRLTPDEYAVKLDGLLAIDRVDRAAIEQALLSSVVPRLTGTWQAVLHKVLGCDPFVLSTDVPLPIDLAVDYPDEVGTDRIANAVGARRRFGAPVIVVDFGTATTLDVVDHEGRYCGGVILPGPEVSAEALFTRTAKLPRVAIKRPEHVIGTNTVACMHSGLFFGFLGAVETLIDRIWAELGRQCPVVATGGMAESIARESRKITAHEPWLTLEGLWAVWAYQRRPSAEK